MLSINQLSVNFGGIKAVDNATMDVEKGKITGLIGPNGAGKTTLFNIIAGNIAPTNGTVFLDEKNITGLQSHELFDQGVLRTFQLAHEFSNMTVLENLMVVPGSQSGEKILNTWFKRKVIEEEESIIKEKAIEVVNFLKLEHLMFELAGNLSGGQKKLLELGRTMMVDAKIVLLDEVGAGVNRTLLNDISDTIKKLNKKIAPKEILKIRKQFRSAAIVRNIYSEVLNIIQPIVISKLKKNKNKKNRKDLEDALLTSIAGISAAMKNTG